jgi:hypothetical protein
MNGRMVRRPALLHLLVRCRGVLVAYCLLAVPAGFDSTLLAQLAWAADPAATQPDDEEDDVAESAGSEAILPAWPLKGRLLPVRLPPHGLCPELAYRCPFPPSLVPCACPAAGPMFRNGVGIPLRC